MVYWPSYATLLLREVLDPRIQDHQSGQLHQAFPHPLQNAKPQPKDETIIAATDLVREYRDMVPPTADKKEQYARQLQQLTAIIATRPLPRASAPVVRVGTPTTSNDTTATSMLKKQCPIHRKKTRNNTPMEFIPEEEEIISEEGIEAIQSEWNKNWYNETRPSRPGNKKQQSKKTKGAHHLPPPNPAPVPLLTPTLSPKAPPIKKSPPTPRVPRRNLPSFQRPTSAAFISTESLNSVIARGYLESPS